MFRRRMYRLLSHELVRTVSYVAGLQDLLQVIPAPTRTARLVPPGCLLS